MPHLSINFAFSHARPIFVQFIQNTNHNISMFVERTKEKLGGTSHLVKMADCAFCVHPSKEIKLLLKAVLLKISKMLTLKNTASLARRKKSVTLRQQ